MIKFKIILFLLVLLWTSGLLAEFFIPLKSQLSVLLPFLRIAYSNVCHQNPMKTIEMDHHCVMVCSRCFGIYAGTLLSSVISPFYFPRSILKLRYLLIASVPMLCDVFLYNIGVYSYSKTAAFLTGLLLGSIVFFYILDAFEKLFLEYKNRRYTN